MSCHHIVLLLHYVSMYHLSQCRISLKGQRSTVPGRTNISHLGKFGTSSNSNVPFVGRGYVMVPRRLSIYLVLFIVLDFQTAWVPKPSWTLSPFLLSFWNVGHPFHHWFPGLCSTGTHPTATCHHCWDNLQVPVRPSIQVEMIVLKTVVETGYIRWSLDFG